MTKISKVLIASALTFAFAAPAFAGEEATLEERNVYIKSQTVNGTESFASTRAPDRMQRGFMTVRPANDWTEVKDQSIKSQH